MKLTSLRDYVTSKTVHPDGWKRDEEIAWLIIDYYGMVGLENLTAEDEAFLLEEGFSLEDVQYLMEE